MCAVLFVYLKSFYSAYPISPQGLTMLIEEMRRTILISSWTTSTPMALLRNLRNLWIQSWHLGMISHQTWVLGLILNQNLDLRDSSMIPVMRTWGTVTFLLDTTMTIMTVTAILNHSQQSRRTSSLPMDTKTMQIMTIMDMQMGNMEGMISVYRSSSEISIT